MTVAVGIGVGASAMGVDDGQGVDVAGIGVGVAAGHTPSGESGLALLPHAQPDAPPSLIVTDDAPSGESCHAPFTHWYSAQ